jgi:hypothetical protein
MGPSFLREDSGGNAGLGGGQGKRKTPEADGEGNGGDLKRAKHEN